MPKRTLPHLQEGLLLRRSGVRRALHVQHLLLLLLQVLLRHMLLLALLRHLGRRGVFWRLLRGAVLLLLQWMLRAWMPQRWGVGRRWFGSIR